MVITYRYDEYLPLPRKPSGGLRVWRNPTETELGAVGPDATLGDGKALAMRVLPAGETSPREPGTEPMPAVL